MFNLLPLEFQSTTCTCAYGMKVADNPVADVEIEILGKPQTILGVDGIGAEVNITILISTII